MSLWIDNGLVKPGEEVRIVVTERVQNTSKPTSMTVYPLYLETGRAIRETLPLVWHTRPNSPTEVEA